MSPAAVPVADTAPAARFTALGTYVHLATVGGRRLDEAERVVRFVLAEVDRTCSRFRPDSDLSRVNARPGRRVTADPLLLAALEVAVAVARDTDGLVTPLLGRTLVSLGYDRDFAALRPAGAAPRPPTLLHARPPTLPLAQPVARPVSRPDAWREIEVGHDWVRLPPGTALDLGSTGKAWASDLAVATVAAELGVGALLSLGGDIAVAGDDSWPVEVRERPDAPRADELLWMSGGGMATSSTRVRRWSQDGTARHHLVDPRTGEPAAEVWRTVTATGPDCVAANAASTAAVVLGDAAPAWLAERGVDARLVSPSGRVVRVGRWPGGVR
jgi:thiamine biosynthesis lipoprotein